MVVDNIELRTQLVIEFERKTHAQAAQFSVKLAYHALELTGMVINKTIQESLDINILWQEGKAKVQEARSLAFALHRLARESQDKLQTVTLRALGQIAATPHVKEHALVATDYLIKIINLLHGNDMSEATRERLYQIELLKTEN